MVIEVAVKLANGNSVVCPLAEVAIGEVGWQCFTVQAGESKGLPVSVLFGKVDIYPKKREKHMLKNQKIHL